MVALTVSTAAAIDSHAIVIDSCLAAISKGFPLKGLSLDLRYRFRCVGTASSFAELLRAAPGVGVVKSSDGSLIGGACALSLKRGRRDRFMMIRLSRCHPLQGGQIGHLLDI
jgi:hypothetical protein